MRNQSHISYRCCSLAGYFISAHVTSELVAMTHSSLSCPSYARERVAASYQSGLRTLQEQLVSSWASLNIYFTAVSCDYGTIRLIPTAINISTWSRVIPRSCIVGDSETRLFSGLGFSHKRNVKMETVAAEDIFREEHVLLKSTRVVCTNVEQCKLQDTNPWMWLDEIKYWSPKRQRSLFLLQNPLITRKHYTDCCLPPVSINVL
jgi:hypothetical protein